MRDLVPPDADALQQTTPNHPSGRECSWCDVTAARGARAERAKLAAAAGRAEADLFERFEQIGATWVNFAVARKLLQAHGGSLVARAEPHGNRFVLSLPKA